MIPKPICEIIGAAPTSLLRSLIFGVAVLGAVPALAADPSRPCDIETTFREKPEKYAAECHYDEAGTLKYWIFYVRPSPPHPCVGKRNWDNCMRILELRQQGSDTMVIRTLGYLEEDEPRTDPLPPHATAITGFPKIWETQKAYRGGDHPLFEPSGGFEKLARDIEATWERRRQRDVGSAWWIPEDSATRQWQYHKCVDASFGFGSGCEIYLRSKPSLEDILASHFETWVIRKIYVENSSFPPTRVDYYPGTLNLETLRLPVYRASGSLAFYWNEFWGECRAATAPGGAFDGCDASLREYISGPALAKTSARRYPNPRLAAKARAIASVADAANLFHAATLKLYAVMRPERWLNSGVDTWHLEPDDIPEGIRAEIQATERVLNEAMQRMRLLWPEFN
jgi:hypothetical protein